MKHFGQFFLLVFIILFSAVFTFASLVDETFLPFVTKTNTTYVNVFAVQPDGKYLVGGEFSSVSGHVRSSLARFNPDGTYDDTFNPPISGTVNSLYLQNDGKILVGGTTLDAVINGVSRKGVLRLNNDGSLDTTFSNGRGNSGVYSVSAQADGKVLIAGAFSIFNGVSRWGLARLNSDGSLDTSFNANLAGGWASRVFALPDGKMFVSGAFTSAGSVPVRHIVRLNGDGTLDTTFNLTFDGGVQVVKFLPDNKILLGGGFTTISGTARKAIARLNADYTVDETFNFDSGLASNGVNDLSVQADGKIVIGGSFHQDLSTTYYHVYRLENNGTIDHLFSEVINSEVNTVAIQSNGQILAGGFRSGESNSSRNLFYRLNPEGGIDPNFPASVGAFGWVGTLGALPNGKIYIGGEFVEVNGKDRKRIARLNANGTLDTSFAPTGTNGTVYDLAAQPDGKVIIVGDFGLINGLARLRIARLNYDGSVDASFNVGAGADNIIDEVAVQADGKILIGGVFNKYNNIPRVNIARLNSDGTLDTTFNTGSPGPSNSVTEIVPLPDGKTLIGGSFGTINGSTVGQIARLNQDGTRDTSFNAGGVGTTGPNNIFRSVDAIVVEADGKIVIGGTFFGYNNITRNGLARLNSDGTLEPNFMPSTQNVGALKRQSDGKILVGGNINFLNGIPQNKLSRLNYDGSLDTTFDIGGGADDNVLELAVQSNGNVLVAGIFHKFGGQDHLCIARLKFSNTPLLSAPFDFDGDGKTDVSIFRPSVGEWWYQRSSDGQVPAAQFGAGTDRITPGDFTGDGKTDIAFWRPSTGEWFILRSEDGSFFSFPFGTTGDIPAPADYDGDGKTDAAVFRPSSGTWFILNSSGIGTTITQFGTAGDVPVAADYDGDSKADIAIYRPSNGQWWLARSSQGVIAATFGTSTDKPVQGDYSGDGKSDIAIWRPSTGEWFILRSEDSSFYSVPFGATGDVPAPGDYDGDGKFDTAVFRPSGATWYVNRTTTGLMIMNFGANGDKPVPSSFVP
jgi:uncharacterized delta-60 repeat protein